MRHILICSLALLINVNQYVLLDQTKCNTVSFNKPFQLSSSCFQVYNTKFKSIIGVWLPQTNSILFTSNRQGDLNTSNQWIDIYTINLYDGRVKNITGELTRLNGHRHLMANGGTGNYNRKSILLCSQGYRSNGGSIIEITHDFNRLVPIITQYNNLSLNSPNDVIISDKDQSIWFTDPQYGFMQNFRYGQPQLDNNVYRFDINGNIQILINDLVRPNGVAFNSEETILYVTESGYALGNGSINSQVPRAIYSYQIYRQRYKNIYLYNKRLLTHVQPGIPDGIKVDQNGYLYVGCGDGVQIFDDNGALLGKIILPNSKSGVAGLVLAGKKLVMLAETEIWTVDLRCHKCKTTLL
ncbi:unnamed protein product [Didymodactylos carnosus]|uniref:SMP-30/Gluconolactonase/LRE-like region domain-containing protein n=1 Tax=Didymodactylos carnosus TaxID=1234261 RepID=A0A815YBK3_9BILA|nr:unnamed protein product [Didymodactylos carnosus]CAF1568350.1 unnamed protein product [Didymodactylos carnosus]CAF4034023.1 unnamed protein product [Didymodactylos carnosus]CAF4430898.1 unnamed protein product [Didymodactylos carnosus]